MKKEKESIGRRDFLKTSGIAIGGSVLTAANFGEALAQEKEWHGADAPAKPKKVQMPSDAEPAVKYGQVTDPELLGDAINAMVQICAVKHPYQHKFNDALVKAHLSNLRFHIKNGTAGEFIQFDVDNLHPIFKRIKSQAGKDWKRAILGAIFEGTGCSFLLYEKIYKRPNERLVVCPFREGIQRNKRLWTTAKITIDDVCNNLCIPRWSGHAKKCDLDLKVIPGEICSIKIA